MPIGTVLAVDAEGYIVSESSPDKIAPPWDGPVNDLKEECIKRLDKRLHSLYIRGSVSRGGAVEGASDVDALAVVYDDVSDIDWGWAKHLSTQLKQKYPFISGIDLSKQSYEGIKSGERKVASFLIKVMSACIYGEDLAPSLPRVKPGREAVIACWSIADKVSPDYLKENTHISVAQKMRWTAKQILRAGFELVMEEEQVYTRDLYPCYKLFSKHYPEMEPMMHRALEMALWPTNDEVAFRKLLNDIGPWIAQKASEKYPKVKPR